jgi:NADPH-dependent glutamate synthase beta subunit-like oxidoreductase
MVKPTLLTVDGDPPRSSVHPPGRFPSFRKYEPFLLESSVPGVFVVGDVRHGSIKRVASAVGEDATAVQFIHRYMAKV